ncbi:hypothetical protein B0T16DRAFT_406849 [Cercophora newfieldiana]|uniref:Uncharacterized protein n=1 Tax=Cercophora newfieldiana TaxID=92897 RepID=A0AA39YIY2_9PEZI|nr:hypothetical protein B0T16DRAFT_406849 [Cercophora newfieldiana]
MILRVDDVFPANRGALCSSPPTDLEPPWLKDDPSPTSSRSHIAILNKSPLSSASRT